MNSENIIIYDSKCNFCRKIVKFIMKNKIHDVTCLPVQDKESRLILRRLNEPFIDLHTIYFIKSGQIFKRSKAIFEIAKSLKRPYFFFSYLSILPSSLTDFFYIQISKRRYKLEF
jgi:predicted DCC family thiol-disulfide oxidoreductase YuxK